VIDVANQRKWGETARTAILLKESAELRAIFWSAYQTAKAKERRSS